MYHHLHHGRKVWDVTHWMEILKSHIMSESGSTNNDVISLSESNGLVWNNDASDTGCFFPSPSYATLIIVMQMLLLLQSCWCYSYYSHCDATLITVMVILPLYCFFSSQFSASLYSTYSFIVHTLHLRTPFSHKIYRLSLLSTCSINLTVMSAF